MQFINALSLAPDARDWLANSCHPRILHVFDHACNLINERREVISIVTPQIGNGPFNLVIEDDVLFSDHLNAQSSIVIRTTQLNLGDLTINTANAEFWSPRPNWERLHANRENILNQLSSLRGRCSAVRSNPLANLEIASSQSALLAITLPPLPLTNYLPFDKVSAAPLISNLSTALAIADIPSSLTISRQLAGLGQGLTPAGDDFIMGAVLAAWIIHPPEIAKVIAKEIANTAAPLTTSLSAAWLRSAGRGEAGILWHEFFYTLISANTMQIQEAIKRILAVGETSGADALAGFIGVFTQVAISQ